MHKSFSTSSPETSDITSYTRILAGGGAQGDAPLLGLIASTPRLGRRRRGHGSTCCGGGELGSTRGAPRVRGLWPFVEAVGQFDRLCVVQSDSKRDRHIALSALRGGS